MKIITRSLIVAVAIACMAAFGVNIVSAGNTCPQQRTTKKSENAGDKNPKTSDADVKAGEKLYQMTAKPMPCKMCHGAKGTGDGPAGKGFKAPKETRNFTCAETMKEVSDGQIFGVIKKGSPPMMGYGSKLSDDQIWQIVSYIKHTFVK